MDNNISQDSKALVFSLAVFFFGISALFGAHVYSEFEAYQKDKLSAYYVNGVLDLPRTIHANKGISDSGKFIRLFYPNGGSILNMGDPYTIFWEYQGISSFMIALQNKQSPHEPLKIIGIVYKDKAPTNNLQRGIYSWNVGELSTGEFIDPSAGWKIIIADEQNPSEIFDTSDDFFAITEN